MGIKIKCKRCKRSKPEHLFYATNRSSCKSCVKKAVRDNYKRNRDHFVAYDKQREQTQERKAFKAEARKRHRAKYPGKYRARCRVGNALRDGRMIKGECEGCGSADSHAHHTDYRRPLAVTWLCKDCHWLQHGSVLASDNKGTNA